jgi:sulfur carrier protein
LCAGCTSQVANREERSGGLLLLWRGMAETLTIQLNGQNRAFENLPATTDLASLIDVLELKADRVAVEHNGEIVPRKVWPSTQICAGDRLEIVHFVGGGAAVRGS